LATQPGDEPRLDLRFGVRDLPGEVVAHKRSVNARTASDGRRRELIVAALVFDLRLPQ
jgi:hypothetical protein